MLFKQIKKHFNRYDNEFYSSFYRLNILKVINSLAIITLFIYTFVFALEKFSKFLIFILIFFIIILSLNIFLIINKKANQDYVTHLSVGIMISLLIFSIFITRSPENALLWSTIAPIIVISIYGDFFGTFFQLCILSYY